MRKPDNYTERLLWLSGYDPAYYCSSYPRWLRRLMVLTFPISWPLWFLFWIGAAIVLFLMFVVDITWRYFKKEWAGK